ncbi:MAG: hypothetical protein V7735_01005 [Photobacterium frigidiphilum]|uniref:hypothetical protein n=1 Tax=Photobacterium frigidiphilum TaxID=264736 RepID=UPI003003306C
MSGAKISYALDNNGNQISILNYYNFGSPSPIYCGGKGCGVLLNHVSEFKREGRNGTQYIPAHYRLAKGIDHVEHCIFKTSGNHSLGVDLSDQDVVSALRRGDDLFRIHIIDTDDQQKIHIKEDDFVNNPNINAIKKDYRAKGKKSTYVKTIQSLKEIYDFGLQNPLAQNKIQLMLNGEKRFWNDFFFSVAQYEELKQKIRGEGIVKAAVVGKVHVVRLASNSNPFEHIEFHPQKRRFSSDNYPIVKLTKSMNSNLFNFVSRVLFYGGFTIEANPNKLMITHAIGDEFRTIVSSESQVIEI